MKPVNTSDHSDLIQDVISTLKSYQDLEFLRFVKTSCPTNMVLIGVRGVNLKKVLKKLKGQTKEYSARQKIELAIQMGQTGIFDCQHTGLVFLGEDKKALKELTVKDIDSLLVNMDNWASVDTFGLYILGYAFRENIISIKKLKSYYQSKDFWLRRLPIVATVRLNLRSRGGKGDPERTLEVCEWAIDDHADLINKAMSWALRELAKVDAIPVIDFIDQYEDRLHSRVLREVRNKIKTGRKNPV